MDCVKTTVTLLKDSLKYYIISTMTMFAGGLFASKPDGF